METKVLLQQFIFWGVWIIIPLLWEVITGFASVAVVIIKYLKKSCIQLEYYPRVTVIIPAYNSQKTLEACLKSVFNQSYPVDKIEVFVIDNGSKDGSYDRFNEFQLANPHLNMWWYRSIEGKSKALNKGIFGCTSKYLINLDSDGKLDENAIKNIVARYESNEKISGMTGVVLIDPQLVEKTEGRMLKTLRLCEFYEYVEAFLVGRNFQSVTNTMYTLAGAFSSFRKEVLMKTQMYNSETVGEDTHMTYQIRQFAGGRITMCEDAFFYVDPIDSLDRLYIQRQRWQRGQLEVAKLFDTISIGNFFDYFKKFSMRIIVSDHTLAFPLNKVFNNEK